METTILAMPFNSFLYDLVEFDSDYEKPTDLSLELRYADVCEDLRQLRKQIAKLEAEAEKLSLMLDEESQDGLD